MEEMEKDNATNKSLSSYRGVYEKWCASYEEERGSWIIAGSVLLASLVIAASIVTSMKTGSAGTGAAAQPTAPTAANNPSAKTGSTSIANAPVMGDKAKVKVAIVEFSDYECPFCKQFHQTTYDQIVKDYVSTGKAVLAYKNFPLPFHEPKASVAAETAECVRQAKGDNAYFVFGKAYYAATDANGKGLPSGTSMASLITQAGANAATVDQCVKAEQFKEAIAKDMSDGGAAGVSGTPSFMIGKLDVNGNVTGELLVGAQPYGSFKTAIDKYLQ